MTVYIETKKRTAILLAILFGFWSWLYTYRPGYLRFWLAWGINFVAFLLCMLFRMFIRDFVEYTPALGEYVSGTGVGVMLLSFFFVACAAWIITWIPAVIDSIIKSHQEYSSYNDKVEKTALFLSILFGPFGWLYTYNKDALKFWGALVLLLVSAILIPTILHFNETAYSSIWNYFKDFSCIPMDLTFELLGYFFNYYFGTINPVSFLAPAIVWAAAVANNFQRYINNKRLSTLSNA
jgi:hypothetical protein